MEYKLILASASPRRHQLMCDAGFKFEVRLKHTEEIWPEGLAVEEVPEYLAGLKAKAFDGELKEDYSRYRGLLGCEDTRQA